jgi:hypothetical protein
MGPIRCAETSVKDYHTTPRNIPEEHRSDQHRGGNLESRVNIFKYECVSKACVYIRYQSAFLNFQKSHLFSASNLRSRTCG